MPSLAQLISYDSAEEDTARTPWLWDGLVAAGKVTLFTSLWKSGKTTLLAHFLARRRTGGEFLGLPVAPGLSLVVSEEPRDLWPERRRRLGLGTELGVLTRPFVGRPTIDDLQWLYDEILALRRQQPLDLVVFDSLAAFLCHSSITRWKSVFTRAGLDGFIRAWQGSPARGPFAASRFQRSN
jgi:hypothetical protein